MKSVIGAAARGENFFDRKEDLAQFWGDLDGDSLLLLAPRRVGKTSVLRRMEETASSHGFQAV
jgi:uncharacterized protein